MSKNNLYCIFIRGLPGSGKSSLSNLLSKKLGLLVLDPDLLSPETKETQKNSRLIKVIKYKVMIDTAVDNLKLGNNIIWEQPWRKVVNIESTAHEINKLLKPDKIKVNYVVIEIETPLDICWERCSPKFDNYNSFYEYSKKYAKYNLKFPVLRLDGLESLQSMMNKTLKWLKGYKIIN